MRSRRARCWRSVLDTAALRERLSRQDGDIAASKRAACSPINSERRAGHRRCLDAAHSGGDATADVVYADQVLEHMSGIDAAREFVAESRRILRSKGVLFVVVPDYLKERQFFWDIDYTHNFITTERRVRQLLYDGGFDITRVVRSIGAATGPARDALAAGAILANLPGLDALSRYTRTEDVLFRVRKNLFETLAFVAHKTD